MFEADLCKALEIAHDAIRLQVKAQEELRDLVGVKGKGIIKSLRRMKHCVKK
ncbi:MAG: hypothetical protein WDN26_13190 [Chitinophagaceae bacterium]